MTTWRGRPPTTTHQATIGRACHRRVADAVPDAAALYPSRAAWHTSASAQALRPYAAHTTTVTAGGVQLASCMNTCMCTSTYEPPADLIRRPVPGAEPVCCAVSSCGVRTITSRDHSAHTRHLHPAAA
eukprot:6433122-Prymnesium_polylepis.1